MDPPSLFSLNDHLEALDLSHHGDPLEVLERTVDFEYSRGWLVEALGYGDGRKGGRPPFDPVTMFKVLVLQAQHNLSDARLEFMIRGRLSWMRFLGFSLGDRTTDENTIRHFRNRVTETGTLKRVMKAFDLQLHKKGYIRMSGQIVDASVVPSPKQRNTDGERDAIKASLYPAPQTGSERPEQPPNSVCQDDLAHSLTRFLRVCSFDSKLRDELLNGEIVYSLNEAKVINQGWRRHLQHRATALVAEVSTAGAGRNHLAHSKRWTSVTAHAHLGARAGRPLRSRGAGRRGCAGCEHLRDVPHCSHKSRRGEVLPQSCSDRHGNDRCGSCSILLTPVLAGFSRTSADKRLDCDVIRLSSKPA